MDNSLQTSLCKGLRACGLPRKQSLEILNVITKWNDNNGPEWTVSRLKDIRQWYETYLAGDPKPPAWCQKGKDQLPLGIWGWLFKQPTGKVLGVLSCTTAFKVPKGASAAQIEKFNHGLNGNGFQGVSEVDNLAAFHYGRYRKIGLKGPIPMFRDESKFDISIMNGFKPLVNHLDSLAIPDSSDITGSSIPVKSGRRNLHPSTIVEKVDALSISWADIPRPTVDFLARENHIDFMPIDTAGNSYQLELDRPRTNVVGRIGCIQQGELKARWIANPNRVVQAFTRPLQKLYMETLRSLPTDCTHNQEAGVIWVQDQLKKGVCLAGSDLSSASDLLDRNACAKAVSAFYGFDKVDGYKSHLRHFLEISACEWFEPITGKNVSWKQGQPLGTGPSFGLMGLTNNLCGMIACYKSGIPVDSFRVIGDDMIIDHRALDEYNGLITRCFGGEINHQKTLTSDKVAEFAGRVITPGRVYLKKVSYTDPSDQNFLAIMAQLGPQARSLLRPRQRQAFDEVRFVPGVAVEGPWLKDSYGEPFRDRYLWYLESSLSQERPEPDRMDHTVEDELLAWQSSGHTIAEAETKLPWPMDDSYLETQVPVNRKKLGDPRLVDGMSTLEVIENHIQSDSWESYSEFKSRMASSGTPKPKEETPEERQGTKLPKQPSSAANPVEVKLDLNLAPFLIEDEDREDESPSLDEGGLSL